MIENHLNEFELYYSLLVEWNEKFNLTAITDRDAVFARHFQDSVAADGYIKKNAYVCDIGSGAGFPGLPLKIVRPDLSVVLFDSVGKKVSFLNEVITRLNLKGISAIHGRIEDAARQMGNGKWEVGNNDNQITMCNVQCANPDGNAEFQPNLPFPVSHFPFNQNFRESFDVAVSRAVAPLPVLCEYALPLIKTGGMFIAYKTEASLENETLSAKNALKALNGKIVKTAPYSLTEKGGGEIRLALIIVEKTAPAPQQYPRGGNKPRLSPL